ncbi:hypothetical protein [Streptomyces peucetius]
MSLDKLLNEYPMAANISAAIAFLAFVVFALTQIFKDDPNRFKGKDKVDFAWRAVLTRSDRSVEVFAGDVSWAQDNKDELENRTRAGVVVRVLCRWPSKPQPLEQVRALIEAGVEVRFYTDDHVRLRGMVADTGVGLDGGTALTVSKVPKEAIDSGSGHAGTDSSFVYEARRYLPGRDGTYIAALHQLFNSVWKSLPQGVIMGQLALTEDRYCEILSKIPHYRGVKADDISVSKVAISSLYSCCRTVKAARLDRISALFEAYQRFNLDLFESSKIESGGGRTLVLPPIVERQPDGRLVVIDGMHRIYHLAAHTDAQQVTCLVLAGQGPLPSTPVPFGDVRVSATKLPRPDNFPDYNHENFRDIKAIDRHLAIMATSP